MKYYIYISDPKIDMLLSQIPHEAKHKITNEIKTDIKLLSVSRKSEREVEDTRIERLETVVNFIAEFGDVGNLENPGEYVSGTLDMRWGPYGMRQDQKEIVYFGGETARTIVGLGGSAHNLLGNDGGARTHSYSITPTLLAFLEDEVAACPSSSQDYPRSVSADIASRGLRAVSLATTGMRGPTTLLEFMAKRLLFGNGVDGKNVLLASPLYVALD